MNKNLMKSCGFNKEVERVESGKCPMCGQPIDITTFRDELSLKEFGISGICQECQDEIFGETNG